MRSACTDSFEINTNCRSVARRRCRSDARAVTTLACGAEAQRGGEEPTIRLSEARRGKIRTGVIVEGVQYLTKDVSLWRNPAGC